MRFLLLMMMLTICVALTASAQPSTAVHHPDSLSWRLKAGWLHDEPSSLDRSQIMLFLTDLLDRGWSEPELVMAAVSMTAGAGPAHNTAFRIVSSSELSDAGKVRALRDQLLGGNRRMLVPLACLLVELGRIAEATAYMEGLGIEIPATRRDLALAAAWYGRYELYPILVLDPPVPEDLEGDSRALQIAGVIQLGWMTTCPDGFFHGDDLVWLPSMTGFAAAYEPGSSFSCTRDWVSTSSIEAYFERLAGSRDAPRNPGS